MKATPRFYLDIQDSRITNICDLHTYVHTYMDTYTDRDDTVTR